MLLILTCLLRCLVHLSLVSRHSSTQSGFSSQAHLSFSSSGLFLRESHTCGWRCVSECVHCSSRETSSCPLSKPSFLPSGNVIWAHAKCTAYGKWEQTRRTITLTSWSLLFCGLWDQWWTDEQIQSQRQTAHKATDTSFMVHPHYGMLLVIIKGWHVRSFTDTKDYQRYTVKWKLSHCDTIKVVRSQRC